MSEQSPSDPIRHPPLRVSIDAVARHTTSPPPPGEGAAPPEIEVDDDAEELTLSQAEIVLPPPDDDDFDENFDEVVDASALTRKSDPSDGGDGDGEKKPSRAAVVVMKTVIVGEQKARAKASQPPPPPAEARKKSTPPDREASEPPEADPIALVPKIPGPPRTPEGMEEELGDEDWVGEASSPELKVELEPDADARVSADAIALERASRELAIDHPDDDDDPITRDEWPDQSPSTTDTQSMEVFLDEDGDSGAEREAKKSDDDDAPELTVERTDSEPPASKTDESDDDPELDVSVDEDAAPDDDDDDDDAPEITIESTEVEVDDDDDVLEVTDLEELETSDAPPSPPAAAQAPPEPPAAPPSTATATATAAPPATPKAARRKPWFEDFFSDDYLRTVRAPTAKEVARECEAIIHILKLEPGALILDVGCGLGMHAVELTLRGYIVIGLDLSLPMLSRAADEAQDRGVKINFLHADMREMAFDGGFDAVLCWGTTFGYFDDDTNRRVLERFYNALKPGGSLLIDVVNRDRVIHSQPNLVWFEGDGCICMEETDFNYVKSRLNVKRNVILDDGRQHDRHYSVRLYSLHELGQMLHQQGFRVAEVSGRYATPGVFFGAESPRIVLKADRRGLSRNTPPPSMPPTPPGGGTKNGGDKSTASSATPGRGEPSNEGDSPEPATSSNGDAGSKSSPDAEKSASSSPPDAEPGKES